jgi:hypothetical protein
MATLYRLVAATLVVACTLGCSLSPTNVWVYIDNAGNEPMVVTVDGKEAATIQPGKVAKLQYPPGDYRFHIRCGDEVLCDLDRKLEKSDRFGVARKYLFNPDKNNRYQTYEAKYGSSRLGNVMEAGLLNFQKDPKARAQYLYKQLLKEIKLIPTDAWNDVTGIDYVLTAPPNVMYTRGGTARCTVLDRIQIEDYEELTEAARKTDPTQDDVDTLGELIDDILSESL